MPSLSPIHYANYALMDRVVSFWRLANGNDAILRNTVTSVNSPTFSATGGKPDGTVLLASVSSQYLTLANASCAGLNFGSGSFSISMWANPTAVGLALSRVFGKGGLLAGTAGFYVGHTVTGRIQFQVSDGTTLYTTSGAGTTAPAASWTHFVMVCDRVADTITIYKNGVSGSSASCAGLGSVTNTSDLYFAGTPTEYNGSLSDVGVWSRALNQTDVTNLYNAGTGIPYPFTR